MYIYSIQYSLHNKSKYYLCKDLLVEYIIYIRVKISLSRMYFHSIVYTITHTFYLHNIIRFRKSTILFCFLCINFYLFLVFVLIGNKFITFLVAFLELSRFLTVVDCLADIISISIGSKFFLVIKDSKLCATICFTVNGGIDYICVKLFVVLLHILNIVIYNRSNLDNPRIVVQNQQSVLASTAERIVWICNVGRA